MKPRRKIQVKEKGTVSTKDPAPTSSLAPPSSLLPALASSLPAPTSSLPAPKPYFIDEKIQVATSFL